MAIRSGDAEALHLYQLIGAPMLSVIQAEAQAAQTSADFIKRVGFEHSSEEEQKRQLQDGGTLGRLRITEFSIDRPGPGGQPQRQAIRIPVLSLFPVPLLQVKHAEFTFDIRVLSRVPMQSSTRLDDAEKTPVGEKDYLSPERMELKGFLAASRGGQAANNAHINVKVRMEQSDLPAGLTRLMSIMEQNIQSVTPQGAQPPAEGAGGGK